MGIAKFSILMNSRYALLSTKIVTEASIDYRREEERARAVADRDRIITLRVILFSGAGPLSYFARRNPIKFYLFN